jgi:hypothetical protein
MYSKVYYQIFYNNIPYLGWIYLNKINFENYKLSEYSNNIDSPSNYSKLSTNNSTELKKYLGLWFDKALELLDIENKNYSIYIIGSPDLTFETDNLLSSDFYIDEEVQEYKLFTQNIITSDTFNKIKNEIFLEVGILTDFDYDSEDLEFKLKLSRDDSDYDSQYGSCSDSEFEFESCNFTYEEDELTDNFTLEDFILNFGSEEVLKDENSDLNYKCDIERYNEYLKEKELYFQIMEKRKNIKENFKKTFSEEFLNKKIEQCNKLIKQYEKIMYSTIDINTKNKIRLKIGTQYCKKFKYFDNNWKHIKYNFVVNEISSESDSINQYFCYNISIGTKNNPNIIGSGELKKWGNPRSGYDTQMSCCIKKINNKISTELFEYLFTNLF